LIFSTDWNVSLADASPKSRKEMTETFDYIVVGGGSSGCVVAARLVAEKRASVLVLEAGHSHRHPLLDMPPGIFKMIKGSKFMTYHKTIPQEHLNGRAHDIPQGNVLGGGSSVNAQVYMRGRPGDYDEWDELLHGDNDNPGWGWEPRQAGQATASSSTGKGSRP
jgi:choline dehydrogenase